ncbi:MFS transporter [Cupriavidus sp. LEh21]|nr:MULTISPECIES: MFS transporter [unclassified Cupriavidus]MDK2659775.1 MFS transporter [Cupriavidus sp. LEh21]
MTHRDDQPHALQPFRSVAFRLLWTASLVANVCTWMSDVSAAWMMSSLTTAPCGFRWSRRHRPSRSC